MLLPNCIAFGNEHSRMADREDMYFVLDSFVHNSIGATECLAQVIGIFRRGIKTFYWDVSSNIWEVAED